MPRGYPILRIKQKEEIIIRIKEKGEKVSDLAKEYGINPKNIYNLLENQINQSSIALELSKSRKEKDFLLQIIGQLVFESKSQKRK